MCFRRQFLCNMSPIQLAFLRLIVWRMFLSSFTLCNTALLFTRSVQLLFFSFLQHHISKHSRYFWSSFLRTGQYYRAILSSSKVSDFYSGGPRFEYWTDTDYPTCGFFHHFLQLKAGQYVKLGYNRFLPRSLELLSHYRPINRTIQLTYRQCR
jgi:hypothetical protein